MGRQRRWFIRIVLTAFFAAVVVGFSPLFSALHWEQAGIDQSEIGQAEIGQIKRSLPSPIAQAQETPPAPPTLFNAPSGQYEIALLDGYQVHTVANTSVIEAPDGRLAYTVVVTPTFKPGTPLTNAALAQVARETFQQGEGFLVEAFQELGEGRVKMDWIGQVTTRGTQAMSGTIFAQQSGDNVFLLMIAATDAAKDDLPGAIATLSASFKPQ
ncbi:MAG: hypothetical protein F6K09_04270 [Merismopedia sp. SIO2A8]|nr:hypothetical protein [Symploca sp. SIO2B6]NET47940.1 hypothetical protein [Merismopedia sp. SIO2A8]